MVTGSARAPADPFIHNENLVPEKIYADEFAETPERIEALADFIAIVKQLRRDCPWDREQTHESVRHLLIEEAYETVEAINEEDWDEVKRELGDLLLHVIFHATIAEQDGRFTLLDVVQAESEKLIRRHPHVFGDTEVQDVGEVLSNWEQIKLKEGARRSALEGVPDSLPALLRAYRIQEKAAGVGFDFPDSMSTWLKVREELEEVRALADSAAPAREVEAEFGDLLFALVNFARFQGIDPESALQRTNARFSRRFRHIEDQLRAANRSTAEADIEEMDRLWDEAKRAEK